PVGTLVFVRTGASKMELSSSYNFTKTALRQILPAVLVSVNASSRGNASGGTGRLTVPRCKTFPHQAENRPPILINQFHPGQRPHLWEINSAQGHTSDENIDPIAQRLVLQRIHRVRHRFGAIGACPSRSHLGMSFLYGHPQRRMSHRKRNELLPML